MIQSNRPEPSQSIYAEVVVRSGAGESLLSSSRVIDSENISQFYAPSDRLQSVAQKLKEYGFEVLNIGKMTITISGKTEVFERSFQTTLEIVERPVIKELGQVSTGSFINAIDSKPFGEIDVSHTGWDQVLDGVAINEPVYYFQSSLPSPIPPSTPNEYLSVPEGVVQGLNATLAHQQGVTGKGVHVVMVDSGWYRHPYFRERNYKVKVHLANGSSDPMGDVTGHGTGESANLLAIAPDITFTMVKADIALRGKTRNVNSIGSLREAIALKPDIISCSWGSDERRPHISPYNRVLVATVAEAIRQGIIVVFAAGNGHYGFPAQHPEVIAAGGAYLHLDNTTLRGKIEASNYASSFISPIYPNRQVPDVCGLVGNLPSGVYIMLPVPPNSIADQLLALARDGTEAIDGWAAFSGTSAAAPQLAGICALMKQVNPNLSPAQAKQILQQTARDVVEGFSNPSSSGASARAGPDLATGYGLVDAYGAVKASALIKKSKNQNNLQRSRFLNSNLINLKHCSCLNCSQTHTKIKGQKVMNPDYYQLKQDIEKIQWEFEEILEKYKIHDLEISINESNFVPRSLQSKTARSLRKALNDCFPLDQKTIAKKHVLAAKSLLKLKKYQETAIEVLTLVITHSKYSDIQELQDLALEALAELEDLNHQNSTQSELFGCMPCNPPQEGKRMCAEDGWKCT